MGRKVVFSTIVAAGLAQMTPALAQDQDQQPGQDRVAAAPQPAAAPADVHAPEVRDKARELAERDLAAAPPEEMKPVLVDPGDARRALARARQAAAEAQERAAPAPRPAVAAAEPVPASEPEPRAVAAVEPAPPPAAPAREARPVYADDDRSPGYLREERADDAARDDRDTGRDAGKEVYADREETLPAEEIEAPVERDLRGRQARQAQAREEAEPLPGRDLRERQARQVYADDEPVAPRRGVEPPVARDLPARPSRPVYAEDDRDAPAAYPEDRRQPADDIYDRAPRPGARYAIIDRSLRPGLDRDDAAAPAWANREANPACDGGRADQLLRNVRRKADFERIDGRAAEDLEDEIGHAASLQRSYCASGMNDWREQRLDRLYAQIEDRIRYEEDSRWRR